MNDLQIISNLRQVLISLTAVKHSPCSQCCWCCRLGCTKSSVYVGRMNLHTNSRKVIVSAGCSCASSVATEASVFSMQRTSYRIKSYEIGLMSLSPYGVLGKVMHTDFVCSVRLFSPCQSLFISRNLRQRTCWSLLNSGGSPLQYVSPGPTAWWPHTAQLLLTLLGSVTWHGFLTWVSWL